jgi:hypothetical protein
MVGDKKEEDIVGRLEALRKKVPPPGVERPPKKPQGPKSEPDEKRKKLARVVGVLVIVIILAGVAFVGSKLIGKPAKTPTPGQTFPPSNGNGGVEDQAKLAELANAKSEKIDEINDAFAGLPSGYSQEKDQLIQDVKTKKSVSDVDSMDYQVTVTDAWRIYRKDEVDEKAAINGGVIANLGEKILKGADYIKKQIDVTDVSLLKGMAIKESRSEFIPIRLPRDQVTGGFADVGDRVNIHYRWVEKVNGTDEAKIKYLARDGKVISIMRTAGTISLSETEQQRQTGGGTEGKGNVSSITVGGYGITISDGPYGASVGVKSLEKSSSYTVNLAEVQKAAAASKVSEEEIMKDLEKYGVRLTEIERKTNIGDLRAEYLILIEVTEDEASELVMRLLDPAEKANIFIAKTV